MRLYVHKGYKIVLYHLSDQKQVGRVYRSPGSFLRGAYCITLVRDSAWAVFIRDSVVLQIRSTSYSHRLACLLDPIENYDFPYVLQLVYILIVLSELERFHNISNLPTVTSSLELSI